MVFADGTGDAVPGAALEALSKAASLGAESCVFHAGPASDEAFAAYGAHGAGKVYHLDTDDALHSAEAAAAIIWGRPWPPSSGSAVMAVHSPSTKSV